MAAVKRGTFELLDCSNYPQSAIVTVTCGERNGYASFYPSNSGTLANVVSFSVDIQKSHAVEHLLLQLLEYLRNQKTFTGCVFEPSVTKAFDLILVRNGFAQRPSDDKYHLILSNRTPRCIGDGITTDQNIESPKSLQPRLHFSFLCDFRGNFAEESEEQSPELHMFLSQNISSQVVKVPLVLNKEGNVTGKLEFWYDLQSSDMPHTTKLNVACFTNIKNKHGEFCKNQAGNASVPVSDLFNICNLLRSSPSNSSRTKQIVLALQIPASSRIEKGKLHLTLDSESLRFENSSLTQTINHEITRQNFESQINGYIESVMSNYESRIPLFKGIQNIHAFQYVSSVGTLPAMFYQHFNVPPSSESYWLNLLEIVLARDGVMNLDQFSSGDGGEKYASRVLAEICAVYVNYCKYITDKVLTRNKTACSSRNGGRKQCASEVLIESFDLVRPRNAGDCEDDGKEELIESFQLKFSFYSESSHPALKRLHDIRNKYYAFSALGAVSSATINGDYEQQQFGAHEWVILLPKSWFYECISRWNSSSPFAVTSDATIGTDLGVQIIEGTGMLRPDGEGKELFPMGREYLEGQPQGREAFKDLRRFFFYGPDGSSFYKVVITLFTNEFLIDAPGFPHVGEFVFETTNRTSKPVYGALFTDVIHKTNNVRIVPQKEVPSELFYHISTAQQDEYPILPFEPPLNFSKSVLPTEEPYKLVAHSLEKKSKNPNFGESFVNPPVEYFMRFEQATPQRIDNMLAVLDSIGGYCDVYREPVSGNVVGGWRLLIYIPGELRPSTQQDEQTDL